MNTLVIGSKGQLGTEFLNFFQNKVNAVGIDKDDIDITDKDVITNYIYQLSPDIIFHCAAYTNVDRAEEDRETAYDINVEATKNITKAANKVGATIIYISTDYVFDGTGIVPYKETDIPNPINYYGATKHLGEMAVQEHSKKFFIFRTAWLYDSKGNNFVSTMLKLAQSKEFVKVVNDQIGTPTYVPDLVGMIWEVVNTEKYGIYNISNSGQTNWCEFAKKIFEFADKKVIVNPLSSELYGSAAKRPAFSVLSKGKIECVVGKGMRDWKEALKECIDIKENLIK